MVASSSLVAAAKTKPITYLVVGFLILMAYTVYILQSEANGSYYIGSTGDFNERLLEFPGEDFHWQDADYYIDDFWELDKKLLISNHPCHFPFVSCPDTIQNYCTGDDTAANHRKHARNFVDAEDWQVDPNYPTHNLNQCE